MKILLDECLPRRLKQLLPNHEVITVPEAGWASIKNGQLLRTAAAQFDLFITVDRNLSFQNPVTEYSIAVLVLHALTNRFEDLALLFIGIDAVLQGTEPGKVFHLHG